MWVDELRSPRIRSPWFALALLLSACGAQEGTSPASDPAEPPPEVTERPPTSGEEPIEATEPEPEPAPPPPPPPPVDIEAGTRFGPIRIGMTEAELEALGLPSHALDPRSRAFGPYRVFMDADGVRRIEATFGEVGPIRYGGEVFAPGVHIHRLRDAFEGCEWYEGGGERYRCARGRLFVQTNNTMDPQRYLLAVER